MKKCVTENCSGEIIKKGSFVRRGRRAPIQRYHCKRCAKNFSDASFHKAYRQHKRHLNSKLLRLLVSNVSQRRSALLLGCTRGTVARKLIFLAACARRGQENLLKRLPTFDEIQFDEMESFEHTKCKPLSIPLAVSRGERIILSYSVCTMPAKGPLAKKSRKKYGPRRDDRREHLEKVLSELKPFSSEGTVFTSDKCPRYPPLMGEIFPKNTHVTVKGRRGCVVGQGELKKIGRDPLFSLNHTAAMIRANVPRMIRKTWNTTKKMERLLDHIAIYVFFHNTVLLKHGY